MKLTEQNKSINYVFREINESKTSQKSLKEENRSMQESINRAMKSFNKLESYKKENERSAKKNNLRLVGFTGEKMKAIIKHYPTSGNC